VFTAKKTLQDKTAVEEVGRYLLTVRAEYFFLVALYYCYVEDPLRVNKEFEEFRRCSMQLSALILTA
jgi:hypothetical protein